MLRRFSVNFAIFSILLDMLVMCLALLAAAYLRPRLGFLPFAAHYPAVIPPPVILYPLFALEWAAINLLLGVYDGKRNMRAVDAFINLTLSSLVAAAALAGTLYLSFREVSRLLFLTFILLAYFAMSSWRGIASWLQSRSSLSASSKRRVLIAGAGTVGREFQAQVLENPQFHIDLVGFLDDDLEKQKTHQDILGNLDGAAGVIKEKHIDDVIITLPQRAYQRLDQLVGDLSRYPVRIWVVPDFFRLALHKASIEEFAGFPMLDLRAPALSDNQRLIKRAFDLVVAITGLVLLLPLLGLIALAIRLQGPGPVFLKQERAGENGKIFKILKFRTMVPGAQAMQQQVEHQDDTGNLLHKVKDDPRITPIGAILRRRSLDELPQLINVIKGEMSLVGPRPELPYLVERYEPWQRARFAVPQGMTGWWQIHGRSDKPMHLNTEEDLYYVQNYSLLLDIYILIKTFAVVWSGKGAF